MTPKELFTDDQLTYSAYSRCLCGAGLAYPKDPTMRQCRAWGLLDNGRHPSFQHWGHWDCSDILTGRAIPKDQPGAHVHTGKLPFAFYNVKSENQPSSHGMNTRVREDRT